MTRRGQVAWSAVALVAAACGGSEPAGPDPLDAIASVDVSPAAASVDVGSSTALSATVRNGRGEPMSTAVTWSSSPSGLVTVTSSGIVTGVAGGVATVTAAAGTVVGAATVTVIHPPLVPTSNVNATALSMTEMRVRWTDNSNDEVEFRIEREGAAGLAGAALASGAVFVEAGTVSPNTTEFVDSDLAPGSSYRYRVLACDQTSCSTPTSVSEFASTHRPLQILPPLPWSGALGVPYDVRMHADGGGGGHLWTMADGALPDGLVLAEAGWITGMPTAAGGFDFRLQVDAHGQVATIELGIDIVDEPDRLEFENASEHEIGVLLDGLTHDLQDDWGLRTQDASLATWLRAAPVSNEIIAFNRGRPPAVVTPVEWTEGADIVDVAFRDPIRISVTAWIVAGPFASLRARALSQAATTAAVWDAERMGVEFDQFEIIDATADPQASSIYSTTTCAQVGQAEAGIGKTAGRINIYYVQTVDNGRGRGYSCGDVIFMADQSGHELLVHEIGHSFGLGHVDTLSPYGRTNVMHSASSTRAYLTEGQVFRQHFDSFTALNQLYGHVPDGIRPCADFQTSLRCPGLGIRLWADGSIPANR